MDKDIKRIERKLVHDGTCLRVYSDTMEFPSGNREDWDMVEHKFNAAAILPILPNGNVILVDQYRPATGGHTWEIPAGKRDDDGAEDPLVCAKRELKEETGYTSDNFEHLFTLMPAVAYSTEVLEIYTAKDLYPFGSQNLDDGEIINIKEFSVPELKTMIKKGEIIDSKTIAAILSLPD